MDKNRLFKILARAKTCEVTELGFIIEKKYPISVIKKPQKVLAMIKIRESVRDSDFYLGELLSCEAMVEIEGKKGIGVTMGDDYTKVLSMAIIDAADNAKLPEYEAKIIPALLLLEEKQTAQIEKENGMYLKTMVNFSSMDSEAV